MNLVPRRLLATALAWALASLASCASPEPDLYTLAAIPGPSAPSSAVHSVELRRVGIAGYLDRPSIVRSSADFRVRIADNERWGEPFSGMLERVLTEDLVQRMPATAVFSESGAISTQPDEVLEIDIQRLDPDAEGTVVLLAQVAVRSDARSRPASARTFRLTVRPASPSTRDLVAAMSQAVGQLADAIARLVVSSA